MALNFLKKLKDNVVDVFDSNTQSDRNKRQAKGEATWYNAQQKQNGVGRVANNPFQRITNTGRATGEMAVNSVVKPIVRTSMAFSQGAGNLGTKLGGGQTQNAQDFYGKGLTNATGYTGTKRQITGDIATNVLNLAVPGGGGMIARTAGRALPAVANKGATKIVSGALSGAAIGGPSNVAALIGEDKAPLTRSNITNAYKQGTIGGAAFGGAIPAASIAAKVVAPVVKQSAQKAVVTAKKINDAQTDRMLPRVTRDDQAALRDVSSYLGGDRSITDADYSRAVTRAREAAQRQGVDITSGGRKNQLEAVNSVLDQIGQNKKVYLQTGTIGKNPRIDETGRATANIQAPVKPIATLKDSKISAIGQELEQAATANKERYAPPTKRQRLAEINNPYNAGVKVDRAFAKASGVKLRNLPKTESLEALADKARNSKQASDQFLRDSGSAKVIQKYRTPEQARDFNTYRLFMRDLEQQADGRPALIRGFTPEQQAQFVQQFEAANPGARADLKQLVKDIESVQDAAAGKGIVGAEQIALARAKKDGSRYEFYTPASRALPEEVERATMNSNSVGSIASQKILQDLKGSDIPIDPSFDSLVDYTSLAFRDMARADVAAKYAERVQQGAAPGTFRQTAENEEMRQVLKQQLNDISSTIDSLKSSTRKTVLAKESQKSSVSRTNQAAKSTQNKLISEIETLLTKAKSDTDNIYNDVVARDPRYAQEADTIKSQTFPTLSKKEAEEQIKYDLAQLDKKYPEPERMGKDDMVSFAKSLGDSNAKLDSLVSKLDESQFKSAEAKQQLQQLREQIANNRDDIAGLRNARGITKEEYAELAPDPTTGLQVISGRKNGQTYKIEVPPEMARFLQGLGDEKLNVTLRAIGALQQPIRAGLTGILNPPFALLNAGFNAVMAPILSPQGFRVAGPKAVLESFKSINSNNQFQKMLYGGGAQRFTGTLQTAAKESSAAALAAEKNIGTKLLYNAKSPKRLFRELDVISAKLENAQRTGIAKAAYDARMRAGGTADQAKADAVYAYNNVLPNFGRQSSLVRQADKLLMYAGASQAGTRALLTALRRDPVGVTARLAAVSTVMTGIAAANLASDEAQDFYDDMVASKKEYLLDNNTIIVLPGAKKDPETGQWSGIVKIPLAPELRPINSSVWQTVRANNKGEGLPRGQYAQTLLDFTTGQARTLNNPALNLAVGVTGNRNLQTGDDVVSAELQKEDTKDQVYSTTSPLAKTIGGVFNTAPVKIDFALRGLGFPGQVAQGIGTEKGVGNSVTETVKNRFVGAKGQTNAAKYYEKLGALTDDFTNKRSREYFNALHKKNDTPGILDSATKAGIYLSDPEVVDKERQLDAWNVEQGKVGNPLFSLNDDQLQKVLAYRQAKMLNSGKQTYDKNGNSLFTSLSLDEPWYDAFREAENGFYDSIKSDNAASDTDPKTFSGAVKPQPTPELQAKLDQYYTLQSGTGDRSRFLRANPDVLQYWESTDGFTNSERAAIGLKIPDEKDSVFGKSYAGGSGGGGGSSSSGGSVYRGAVSPTAGLKFSAPKVSVKSSGKTAKAKKKGTYKPKVTLKRNTA